MYIKFIAVLIIIMTRPLVAQDLLTIYQLALENDPQLKQVYLHQFSVAESRSQNVAQMLPVLSISANSSMEILRNKKDNFQQRGTQRYQTSRFTINFSQPIFHWQHWLQLSQSDNKIMQAEAEYKAATQHLMVKVTEAYFDILSAQDSLKFTVAEQVAIERQLEQTKQRFSAGLIAITNVYEAQARYDQAVANHIDAVNLLHINKEALAEIIGENKEITQALRSKINLTPPEPNDIAKWSAMAVANNFNIIAALNRVEVHRKNIAIQQSGHLPTLDIVGNYSIQDVSSSFGQRGDSQQIGLQFNLPLFQGGGVYSQAKQAHYDYQVAKERLLSTQRRVRRQIRNAFRDCLSNLSRIHALKTTIASARSALEASEVGLKIGSRTMVDVLGEQSNLYRAKRNYARSRYDYLLNGIKLKWFASSLTEEDLRLINQYLVKP